MTKIIDILFSVGIYVAIAAIIFYFIPSALNPVIWTEPFPLPSLDGPIAPNTLLSHTIKKGSMEITAPESMTIDSNSGDVFASLNDGRVVLIDKSGAYKKDILFSGKLAVDVEKDKNLYEHMKWCQARARSNELAWHVNEEKSCGRPLGLRLVNSGNRKILYVLDAYTGLYLIEFDKSLKQALKLKHLVSPNTRIVSPIDGSVDPKALLPPKFFNDLDIQNNGIIYFSDSSYTYHRSENRQEVLDGSPRGRFFSYDPSTYKLTVLVCGLHFPNGVQVYDQSSVLVVESTRFRILKVNTKQLSSSNLLIKSCGEYGSLWNTIYNNSNTNGKSKKSEVEVFLDRGPGFMDNIRKIESTKGKDVYLIGIGTKSTKPFSLLWFAYQESILRNIIGRIMPMRYVEKLTPKYGFVLAINQTGAIIGSLQDPSGNVSFISEAHIHPITGDVWLGSHSNPYVGILPKDFIPRYLRN